ncbi:MAG: YicC/YloC family endoribonuclease [Myxococcota bacterium]
MRSMTGYGSGEATIATPEGAGRFVVDARTVNHRYLDLRARVPAEVQDETAGLEELARRTLRRGRVEITVRHEGGAEGGVALDVARARAAFDQLQALRDELAPGEPLPLSLLGAVPELFTRPARVPSEAVRSALREAVSRAFDAVDAMRLREGGALRADLEGHLAHMREGIAAVRAETPGLVEAHRKKLRDRLDRLLEGRDARLDDGRLEQEVAIFVERADVSEELARLAMHCDQLEELMAGEDTAQGRKLDFLLQEIAREVNTLGAKTPAPAVTRLVVDLKADVERMREQVQNVL